MLKIWKGKDEAVAEAQDMLLKRATANGLASLGKFVHEAGAAAGAGGASLFERNYTY